MSEFSFKPDRCMRKMYMKEGKEGLERGGYNMRMNDGKKRSNNIKDKETRQMNEEACQSFYVPNCYLCKSANINMHKDLTLYDSYKNIRM